MVPVAFLLLTTATSAAGLSTVEVSLAAAPTHNISASFFSLTADSCRFSTASGNRTATLLRSVRLRNMLLGLSPLVVRVGGTFTDFEVFPGPHPGSDNPKNVTQLRFSTAAWDALHALASKLPGSRVVVSVSGLLRHWKKADLAWDSTNAEVFIRTNYNKGYQIYGYELGNEPGCWGSHGGSVSPAVHARDFALLRNVIDRTFRNATTLEKPLVIGADTTGCGAPDMFKQILDASPSWDISTVHLYSVTPNQPLSAYLAAAQTNAMCRHAVRQLGWLRNSSLARTPLWNGEGGASYLTTGAGGYLHQFGGALSLLNNVGCLATSGVSMFLKHDLFENMFAPPALDAPYPTFWAAYMVKQLITNASTARRGGTTAVLPASVKGSSSLVHVYAFASSHTRSLLVINLGNESVTCIVPTLGGPHTQDRVYNITAHGQASAGLDSRLNAPEMALNGQPLRVTSTDGTLPDILGDYQPLGPDRRLMLTRFSAVIVVTN